MTLFTNPIYPKVDPQLHRQAKLVFKFPNPGSPGKYFTRTCPFFENPTIKESRSANIVKYNPIGRAGTLMGYTGAKSRTFSITFELTLPHIMFLSQGFPAEKAPSDLTKEEQKEMFFIPTGDRTSLRSSNRQYSFDAFSDLWLKDFSTGDTPFPDNPTEEAKALHNQYGDNLGFPGIADGQLPNQAKYYREAVMLITYWSNLIRSSVLNYAPNPAVGPPIIYLTFGMLYQKVPTIAEKYSFTIDDKAGYDVVTLLPRKINISLSLEEIRTNAGAGYAEGGQLVNTNLRGWEGVIGREVDEAGIDPTKPIHGGPL